MTIIRNRTHIEETDFLGLLTPTRKCSYPLLINSGWTRDLNVQNG